MSSTKYISLYAFYLLCCGIAIWMTERQINTYFKNQDSSSVTFKSFHTSTKNNYPDFSFCFKVDPNDMFNESKLPKNISSSEFRDMLSGPDLFGSDPNQLEMLNTNKDLLDLLTSLSSDDVPDYEDVLNHDARGIVDEYHLRSLERQENKRKELQGFLRKTYHSTGMKIFATSINVPVLICETRVLNYIPGQIILSEHVKIQKEVLENLDSLIVVFHHPNQLLRSKGVGEIYPWQLGLKTRPQKNLIITVKHVRLIHRRQRSKERDIYSKECDKHLLDDDTQALQTIAKMLGCIPAYFKHSSKAWNNSLNISYCTTYEKHWEAFSKYIMNKWYVYEQYAPPCTIMSVLSDISTEGGPYGHADGDSWFHIVYELDDYEEITNQKKMDWEALFSQMGGFIGIMLGVSIFSIPDIFMFMISKVKTTLRKTIYKTNETSTQAPHKSLKELATRRVS